MNKLMKNNNSISKPRFWTPTAIECYERNCECDGCPINKIIETACKMRKTVKALLDEFGPPLKAFINSGLSETENKIIALIVQGIKTKEEISAQIGLKDLGLFLKSIYLFLENKGVKLNYNNKFNEAVAWLQENYKKNEINFYPEENVDFSGRKEIVMYRDEDLNIEYSNSYIKILDAIKMGYFKWPEIGQYSGLSQGTVCTYLNKFIKDLEEKGLIQPEKKSAKERVINFVQSRVLDREYIQPAVSQKEEEIQIPPESLKEEKESKKIILDGETPLTAQEIKVLNLLLGGFNYKAIAEKLVVSLSTIKTHVNAIFEKKHYHSLQELLCSEFEKKLAENQIKQADNFLFEAAKKKISDKIEALKRKYDALCMAEEICRSQ